ncbi:MAG: hypothetical protein WBM13_11565 [Bacteroidia bacterium]
MLKLNRFTFVFVLFIGIVVLAFITTKAKVSSFTHDESYTYNAFVNDSFINILSYKNSYTNNHLLNTLMMKYAEIVFGNSELALRLPNLLMLIVLFIYTILVFKNKNYLVRASVFIILITNTSLIDIFGLARGYGISIAFMLMALYHLIKAIDKHDNTNDLILFNSASLFAILANFTMLDFYLAAIVTYTITKWLEYKFILTQPFRFFKINKVNFLLFVPMFIVLYEPVRRVVTYNQFNFGGSTGFFADTIQSLVYALFSGIYVSEFASVILKFFVVIIVLFSCALYAFKTFKRDIVFFEKNKSLLIVNLIIIFIFLEIIMQHLLLNTDYLVGRFALFLIPLFVINLGLLINCALEQNLRNVFLGIISICAISSMVNFFTKFDFYSCAEWGYDSNTKNAILELKKNYESDLSHSKNVKLQVNWLFEPTVNFYRKTLNLNWLQPVNRDTLSSVGNYYYIFNADLEALKLNNYNLIYSGLQTNTVLIKNNNL